MNVLRVFLLISAFACTAMCQQNSPEHRPRAPASCSVTHAPAVPFMPPGLPERVKDDNAVWFGTEKLWTSLQSSGDVWGWAPRPPRSSNLTAKIFWYSVDYDRHKEGNADLKVTGRRLDEDARPMWTLPTTNALGDPYDAMLTGVYMPTPGCWEITGAYKGQKLSFVVWLHPVKQANE
jgi:hypothetical protein